MTFSYCGWLFGLEGAATDSLKAGGVTVRPMSTQERETLGHATDFFAHDPEIWINTAKRFPFVYEKEWPDNSIPIGGEDNVGILLSLLSAGEVRTPIQWTKDEKGNRRASLTSSEILTLFFRVINLHFQTVAFETVSAAFTVAAAKLQRLFLASADNVLGAVLLDRFISTKTHPISMNLAGYSGPHIVARAADVAMMLEYLFHEGSTTETGFRLGMSVAWMLGSTPEERKQIFKTVRDTYGLRSKRVHGVEINNASIKSEMLTCIAHADRLLRRAIVVRLLADTDDAKWRCLFSSARIGALPGGFDQAHWVP